MINDHINQNDNTKNKVKWIGRPQISEKIAYVSPDQLNIVLASMLLPEYRKMIIPQNGTDEKVNELKNNLNEIVNDYDSGKIKQIVLIRTKNLITTNLNGARVAGYNLDVPAPNYSRGGTTLDFGVHRIKDLAPYFKETLKDEIKSDYHLIE